MAVLKAKSIYCPNTEQHPRKKILLLLHEDSLFVHCKDHGWIQLELALFGKPINFEGASVKVSQVSNVHFDLEPLPIMAVGYFVHKKGMNEYI